MIVTPSESPSESAVSPAWVEGTVVPSATSVTVSVDGGQNSFAATRMDRIHWFADNSSEGDAALGITLSKDAATIVDVTAGFEGDVTMTASRGRCRLM